MRRLFPHALVMLFFTVLSAGSAFAAGGKCPSASTYLEPVVGNTTETLATMGVTSCFYIDFGSGLDTNNGTSEATPWKYAPGMEGCSNTCSSTTPTGGEGFIFKGGDTWTAPNSSLFWNWTWGGGAGSPIYLGYDPAWYSGSSWARPIISGGGVNSLQFASSSSAKFLNIDNFEWTDMFNNQASGSQNVCAVCTGENGNMDIHFYNNYFHGSKVSHDGAHASHYVYWGTAGNDNTSTLHHNVFDNSDVCTPPGPCTMTALEGGPRQVFMNYFGYFGGSTIVTDNPVDFHNNTLEWQTLSPDNGTDHENMFESNGETGAGAVLYNNVVRHGHNCGVVDFQLGPNSGITSYGFNNVLPDMDGCNMQQTYEGGSSLGTVYWFNNTAEAGQDSGTPGGSCGRDTGTAKSLVINQHCITSDTGTSWWNGSATFTTDPPQSKSAAAAEGYTASQTYSFSPTSASGSTVGAGTNESSICTAISAINAAAGSACMQDTSYGVAYDTSTHTITGAGRASTNARPATGVWDVGAYQFGQNTQPSPPTGLAALVQ